MDFFKTIKESRSKVAKFGTSVSCKYFCTADRQDSKAGSVLILKVFVFFGRQASGDGLPFFLIQFTPNFYIAQNIIQKYMFFQESHQCI